MKEKINNLMALVNKKTKEVVGHSYDDTMVNYLKIDKKVLRNKNLIFVNQSEITTYTNKLAIYN